MEKILEIQRWQNIVVRPGLSLAVLLMLLGLSPRDGVQAAITLELSDYELVVTDAGGGGYEAFPDICRLPGGLLMCVFYEGYSHISPPIPSYPTGGRIAYRTSSDEGETWNVPGLLYDDSWDNRDPSITAMSDGRLLCTYFNYADGYLASHLLKSVDGGASWSAPRQLAPAQYAVSSPVLQLSTGRLVAGLYYENPDAGEAHGAVALSDDGGDTWTAPIDIPNSSGVYLDAETNLIELSDGTLWAVQRASHAPARLRHVHQRRRHLE